MHLVVLHDQELLEPPVEEALNAPQRLFESPYTDHASTGPDFFFPDADVDVMVEILNNVRRNAVPMGAA